MKKSASLSNNNPSISKQREDSFDTYFIRHNMGVDDETMENLWKDRRIAIHFPWDMSGNKDKDSSSRDPEKYKKKNAMRALNELANEGGYVCAQYADHENEVIVGFVPPGSEIKLINGKWSDSAKNKAIANSKMSEKHSGKAILKSLELRSDWKLVETINYAVMRSGRPRQATITKWPSARNTIINLVEGRRTIITLESLSFFGQETLCAEFLRTSLAESFGLPRLIHLLTQVGGAMKDIDILGMDEDGKQIVAQVTYAHHDSDNVREKIKRLKKYEGKKISLILFCDIDEKEFTDGINRTPIDGIHRIPIKEVFKEFTKTPSGKKWLKFVK